MITRREYMQAYTDHPDREALHQEYYGQFSTEHTVAAVVAHIGKDRILSSTDPHMNDIPLRLWDDAPWFGMARKVAEANGTGGVSLADKVCALKAAARKFQASQL